MANRASYRIDVYNTSGTKLSEIVDFLSLSYVKKRNAPGECVFELDGSHLQLSNFSDNCYIQVWRKNLDLSGSAWERDFSGIYRSEERTIQRRGIFTANCPGILDLLNDRIVAYPPTTVNRSEFTSKPVETILHTLVKYNATSSGTTADGRVRLATISGVSVPADSARGTTVDFWECAEQGLLDTMYELATKYKVAYTLANLTASTFEWQYVVNTDVSASQIFSISRGNVEQITYKRDRRDERTVAIIGSTGEGTLKNYDVRTGTNYNVSTNNREMYVNSGSSDIDEIYLEGDRELSKREAKDEVVFTIRQTDSSLYKSHFDLNYLVTGRYGTTDYQLVVSEISINVLNNDSESVHAVLEDV